jgi:glycosyltransferase involved in cell wall biosynthesis
MRPVLVLATDSRQPSGLGEHMLTLGQALSDKFDVAIAAEDCDGGADLLKRAAALGLRIKAFEFDRPDAFKSWLADHATLLHVHAGIGWEGHDLVRIGKAAGLPVIRTEHLPYVLTSPIQQAEYGAMLLSVDRVITVSRAAYDSFSSRHGTSRFALVPNGIAPKPTSADRDSTRQAFGVADGPLVLTVARFTPQKGHSTLLEAVPLVLEQHPRARFVWVGDGPDFPTMEEAVQRAGLEEAVTLLGLRDDVPDLLAAADLMVLPSLFEGLPLVLLEAMAAGVPVVTTQIGGSVEAVGEGHPFFAVPGDAAALAKAIISALDDPAAAKASGDAGRQRFNQHFLASRMAAHTADIYASVMAQSSPLSQARSA